MLITHFSTATSSASQSISSQSSNPQRPVSPLQQPTRDEARFSGTKRKAEEELSPAEGSQKKISTDSQNLPESEIKKSLPDAARRGDVNELAILLNRLKHTLHPPANQDHQDREGKTALHHAIEANQLETARLLLANGASPKIKDREHHTPISRAAYTGNVEALKLFNLSSFDLNPPEFPNGERVLQPLHTAVRNRQFEAAAYLIQQGAFTDGLESQPNVSPVALTPLMIASLQNDSEMMDLLLSHGAEIEAEDEDGFTALSHAAKHAQWQSVETLLKRKANPEKADEQLHELLAHACESREVEQIRFLLRHGIRPDEAPHANIPILYETLQNAVSRNDLETARLLLKGGLNPTLIDNGQSVPAIVLAAAQKNDKMVKLLLKYKANIDEQIQEGDGVKGQTALHQAAKNNDAELVDFLMAHDAHEEIADDEGRTAVTHAIESGHNELVKKLHEEYGAALDWAFDLAETTQTPMLAAAEAGNLEMLRYMLDNQVNLNQPNKDGVVPLMGAKNRETAELLLRVGADVNAKDDTDDTALMYHASEGSNDIVGLLLCLGANVDDTCNDGGSALIRAAAAHSPETVRRLLRARASVNHENILRETALTEAVGLKKGEIIDDPKNAEVLNILLDAGARIDQLTVGGHTALSIAVQNLLPDSVETLLARGANSEGVDMGDGVVTLPDLSLAAITLQKQGIITDNGARVLKALIEQNKEAVHTNEELKELAQAISKKSLPYRYSPSQATNRQQLLEKREERFQNLRKLLEAGVPVSMTQPYVAASVQYAARHNQEGKLDLLLGKGLAPDETYQSRYTPLMLAADQGSTRAINQLLKAGANPNLQNRTGDTPFSMAASQGCFNSMLRLLQAGADPAPHIDHTRPPKNEVDEADSNSDTESDDMPLRRSSEPTALLNEQERRDMVVSWPVKMADARVKTYVESLLGAKHNEDPAQRKVTWNRQPTNHEAVARRKQQERKQQERPPFPSLSRDEA